MPAMSETARPPLYQKNSQQHVFPPFPGTLPRDPTPGATQLSTSSRHSTRTCTPVTEPSMTAQRGTSHTKSCPQTLVHHSLQIPSCISSQGGNLADFAAQVCLCYAIRSLEVPFAIHMLTFSPPGHLFLLVRNNGNAPSSRIDSIAPCQRGRPTPDQICHALFGFQKMGVWGALNNTSDPERGSAGIVIRLPTQDDESWREGPLGKRVPAVDGRSHARQQM